VGRRIRENCQFDHLEGLKNRILYLPFGSVNPCHLFSFSGETWLAGIFGIDPGRILSGMYSSC